LIRSFKAHKPELLYSRCLSADFGKGTDKYWSQYIKRYAGSMYHPTGTCKMGALSDPMAVVDPSLRVIGVKVSVFSQCFLHDSTISLVSDSRCLLSCGFQCVKNLRVADASVMADIYPQDPCC